ncbi:hypothetical protein F5882DRAFT_465723 [Hyaloscypha sp. PMI_1271]|nr:hypothetical protein F5882DRAFT_465723 [Hyaloscypha sp. PMI_1271]
MSSITTTQTSSISTATIRHESKRKENVDSQRVLNEVEKYQEAWKQKGMVAQNDLPDDWYRPKQNDMVQPRNIGFAAWAGAFMNSWNSKSKDIVAPPPPIGMRDLLHHLGTHPIRDDIQGGQGSRSGSQAQSDGTPQGHEDVHEVEMQE